MQKGQYEGLLICQAQTHHLIKFLWNILSFNFRYILFNVASNSCQTSMNFQFVHQLIPLKHSPVAIDRILVFFSGWGLFSGISHNILFSQHKWAGLHLCEFCNALNVNSVDLLVRWADMCRQIINDGCSQIYSNLW